MQVSPTIIHRTAMFNPVPLLFCPGKFKSLSTGLASLLDYSSSSRRRGHGLCRGSISLWFYSRMEVPDTRLVAHLLQHIRRNYELVRLTVSLSIVGIAGNQ